MKAIVNIIAAGLLMVGMPCLAFEGEVEATVSVSGSNARTSADLSVGLKEVDCDVAVYYRMGTSTAVATTNDASRVANTRWYVNITPDGRRMAFITGGGSGTCRIYPVNFLAASRMAGSLIASLPIPSTLTLTGDITADHFHATALATENAFNAVQSAHYTFNDPTNTVYLDYNGTVLEVAGAPLDVGTTQKLCFGTGGCLKYGGTNVIQTDTGVSFVSLSTLQTQSNTDVWGALVDTNTGANCSSNTGAVCVNDADGFAVANGSGTTVATISSGGKVVGTSLAVTDTKAFGTITLSTGTGTATVNSGSKCICTDSTANASVKCSVSSTTLTATGTGSDVITYLCITTS